MKTHLTVSRRWLVLVGITIAVAVAALALPSVRPTVASALYKLGIVKSPDRLVKPATAPISATAPRKDTEKFGDKVIVIYITPNGFEPERIDIPAGPTQVFVRNGSGSNKIDLALLDERGSVQSSFSLPLAQRQSFRVDLPPGVYTLADPTDREHVCQVVVR